MSILEIENLSFSFSRKESPIIQNFSFAMEKGEIVGILGASGSGKSTLLRLIAGLELPTQGQIKLSEKAVVGEGIFVQPEARGVGMVFQDYALFPHMNVMNNILFALHRLPSKERRSRMQDMLELVQMTEYANRYPHELSGGQQQRVALARALAPKPVMLLMDEPFSNLDTQLKAVIRKELRSILRNAGMTCLLVTHDPADVNAICDRNIVLKQNEGTFEKPCFSKVH